MMGLPLVGGQRLSVFVFVNAMIQLQNVVLINDLLKMIYCRPFKVVKTQKPIFTPESTPIPVNFYNLTML